MCFAYPPFMAERDHKTRVSRVLCTAHLADGETTIAAVELDDGRFTLMYDGKPSPDDVWPATQLDGCINAFLALRWEARLAAANMANMNNARSAREPSGSAAGI